MCLKYINIPLLFHVSFVLNLDNIGCLFQLVNLMLLLILTWFMLMCGVLIMSQRIHDINTSLHQWITIQEIPSAFCLTNHLLFILQSFIHLVQIQFKTIIKVLRFNNVFELGNSPTSLSFYSLFGIIHQLSSPYHINRFLSRLLQNKTLCEMIFPQPPPLIHLRSFGCLCFLTVIPNVGDKFEPRSYPNVSLGYPFARKNL